MTDYRITTAVRPRGFVLAAPPLKGVDGARGIPPTWRNEFWQNTPEWARPVFESLSQWLARPTFYNGILVGEEGVGPQRDPDTGVWTYPPVTPIDANGVGGSTTINNNTNNYYGTPRLNAPGTGGNPTPTTTTIYAWSMQSDNYNNSGYPWPGWRLDRSGWAQFDAIGVNAVYSRGPILHFQFNGADPLARDRSSVSISQDGVLSAPTIVTANIIHNEAGGPLQDLWLNDGVVVHPAGWLDAARLTVSGVDVSLAGHTHAGMDHGILGGLSDDDHTQYLTTGRHDTTSRHGSSVVDHGSIGGLSDDDHPQYHNDSRGDSRYAQLSGSAPSFSSVTVPTVIHPSGSGSTITVTGTMNATGLKVGGVSVSLAGHTHDHGADLTGLGDDDHTQYHNDARGDARYSLLGHTHTSSSVGIKRGYKNATTDGNGEISVAHGLGTTPASVIVVSTANNSSGSDSGGGTPSIGGAGINLVVHSFDSTNFAVRVHDSTVGGAGISSLNVAFYWIAVA